MTILLGGFHRLNSLQYLRALCALAVVFYHVEGGAHKYWPSTTNISLFSWGNQGVPMFFCLSGFIIAYSGYLRPKRWREFMYSRLARIYPAYIATGFAVVVLLTLLPAGTFSKTWDISFEAIARSLLFELGKPTGFVYVGWTLFYEMCFYLFFSFLVFRFSTIAKSKYFHYAISSGLILCYLLAMTRVADFLIGISMFLLVSNALGRRNAIACFSLIASVLLGIVFHPVGLICGIILLSLLAIENIVPEAFRFKSIITAGDSSYSIYLIQVITVSASLKAAKLVAIELPSAANDGLFYYIIAMTIAAVSTTLLGIMMRRYLEKPSYKYLMGLRNKMIASP